MRQSTRTRRNLPPGPGGSKLLNLVRHVRRYSRIPRDLRDEYGDIVYYEIPFRRFCFLYDVDVMYEVFTAKAPNLVVPDGAPVQAFPRLLSPKTPSPYAEFPLMGITAAEDEQYQRVHRLMAEGFVGEKYVEAHSKRLIENVDSIHGDWTPGSVIGLKKEMTEFMAHGLLRMLVGTEVDALPPSVLVDAMEGYKIDTILCYLPATPLLRLIPLPVLRKGRRALKDVNAHIYNALKELRRSSGGANCVASCLLEKNRTDPEDERFTDEDVRELLFEVMTTTIDSTAVAIMRSFGHVAYHQEVRQKLEQEVDAVAGDRPVAVGDYDRLRYTKAVFLESLRYETPATAVFRMSTRDSDLGDYTVPADTTIMCVISIGHRDPRYWADPDEFQPDRWLEDPPPERPMRAFMPFGFGMHECVGAEFAIRAAVYLLASTAQRRLRLDPVTHGELESTANPFLLSIVKGPVPMTVTARRSAAKTR